MTDTTPEIATNRTASTEFVIRNPLGVYGRLATLIARCAMSFESDIELRVNGRSHSAKSVLDLLMAHLASGTRGVIAARGIDSLMAVEVLVELIGTLGEWETPALRNSDFEED